MSYRIQHVSIPRPPGSDDETRAFYGGVLGLEEKFVPSTIQHLDLIWFKLTGDTELHVFAEEPTKDATGRHFCLAVPDLQAVRQRLTDAGVPIREPERIGGRPRFFARDPFNNQIEFTEIQDDYMNYEEAE
jgi:catechol 2,3-dioxygenase-like lactoylglutathione lyase family enzyme